MTNKNQQAIGIFIIIAGIVILLGKWGVFSFLGKAFWPLIILVPGILLHVLYFGRMAPAGVLVPGGMLTVYGVLFFICNTWGWSLMSYLWPTFILGVATGLYEYYEFEQPKPRGVMTASVLLGVISIILLGFTLLRTSIIYVIAVLLIAGGIWMIWNRGKSSRGW
ncbi:hypothetical protein PASE110613_03095 [Paenibacillus sediminis]|uniref:DUF5668 domain-containing protein n=1 Tax=Paenibacillus sediminis TaxID=664909 RepID=A0ABS4GZX1_9BACL|nr:hypothetical protein [Paenibacillus sediminis]MBP1935425.1 hypothetical protein [Paenibacillus sediminis]